MGMRAPRSSVCVPGSSACASAGRVELRTSAKHERPTCLAAAHACAHDRPRAAGLCARDSTEVGWRAAPGRSDCEAIPHPYERINVCGDCGATHSTHTTLNRESAGASVGGTARSPAATADTDTRLQPTAARLRGGRCAVRCVVPSCGEARARRRSLGCLHWREEGTRIGRNLSEQRGVYRGARGASS